MGAGKTKIGKLLASKLDTDFYDIDSVIENKYNRKISEIFSNEGEEYFRELETETLKDISSNSDKSVISTGGGIVIKDENWAIMNENGITVYLDVDIETLWSRIKDDPDRPLVNVESPYEAVCKLFEDRKELYIKADYLFKTDILDPDKRADKLVELIF